MKGRSLHRVIFILIFCCLFVHTHAQTNDFSLGAHVGGSMYITDGPHRNLPGAAAGLDMAYSIRGVIANQTALGVKLGASLTFANAKHSLPDYHEQYINIDYYPEELDYSITSQTYTEKQLQFQIEIPVFISFFSHGLVANIGAKYMMPFYQHRTIDVREAHISVYYPDYMVSVTDYLATGRLEDYMYHDKQAGIMPQHNILLAAELGYEWQLSSRDRLGLQVYVDYTIWNNYGNTPSGQRLIDVEPILNTSYPVPKIHVNPLVDTYASDVRYLSFGISFYYAFHHEKRKIHPCRCFRE